MSSRYRSLPTPALDKDDAPKPNDDTAGPASERLIFTALPRATL